MCALKAWWKNFVPKFGCDELFWKTFLQQKLKGAILRFENKANFYLSAHRVQ